MESIVRNVSDLSSGDRAALEHVVGQPLHEGEQVIVQVVAAPGSATSDEGGLPGQLPDWCQVNDGLTEEEQRRLDEITSQRLDLTRR